MTRPDDDVARDAWLSEALRHAPDADAAPPAALSETILRQARAAAAAATPASTPPRAASFGARLSAWWSWLGRPPVAAGFASVMVAGVVGLMWWDRSPEELMPPRAAAPTAATAPATAPAETPAAVAALPAPAPAQPPAPTAEPAAPRVAARAPTPTPAAAAKRADASRQGERERLSQASGAAPERREARRSQASDEAGAATGAAAAAAPVAPAAPRPAPPAPPAPSVALADAAPPASADAPRSATAALESDTGRAERSERARLAAPVSKAAAPALQRDFAAAPSPLPALRAAIASQPERWQWQRDGAALQPLHDPLVQWLRALDVTALAPWQPVAADAAARGDAADLALWLDGRLHTRLRLEPDAVIVAPAAPGATRQRAALPAADAATLRAALDRATR